MIFIGLSDLLSLNFLLLPGKLGRWHGKQHFQQDEEVCLCPYVLGSPGAVDKKETVYVSLGFGESS